MSASTLRVTDADGQVKTLAGDLSGGQFTPNHLEDATQRNALLNQLAAIVAALGGKATDAALTTLSTGQASGNAALASILATLQAQVDLSTTLWTDDTNAFFVRRDVIDQDSNTVVVSFTTPAGATVSPGAGLRPAANEESLATLDSLFAATASGTGYTTGDLISRQVVVNQNSIPPSVVAAVWVNLSTGAVITAPSTANLVLAGSALPVGASTAAKQDAIVAALAVTLKAYTPGGLATVTGSFARPADNAAYTSGDLIASATVAGGVAPIELVGAVRVAGEALRIERVRLRKSGATLSNAVFRVHLFRTLPVVSVGDNAALDNGVGLMALTDIAGYLGFIDVTMDRAAANGAMGVGMPATGAGVTSEGAGAAGHETSLYALIEARGAYAPANGETFTLTIEGARS